MLERRSNGIPNIFSFDASVFAEPRRSSLSGIGESIRRGSYGLCPKIRASGSVRAEPFADTQAAYLIEGVGAVYGLVGRLVKNIGEDRQSYHHLLIGEDIAHPVDERLVPLFEWFTAPRYESQVTEWLRRADAPSGFLEALLRNGLLVRIDTANPQRASKSLRGIRLVPLSFPDLDSPTREGFLAVKRSEDSRADTSTSVELAEVLWGNHPQFDVPSAVKFVADLTGMNLAAAALRILTDVPMLLEYGFIRLEWVEGRRSRKLKMKTTNLSRQQTR